MRKVCLVEIEFKCDESKENEEAIQRFYNRIFDQVYQEFCGKEVDNCEQKNENGDYKKG